jgi:hypothetical protein
VALLIDSHTTQTFKPEGLFEESNIYWDGHHGVYGLKNEVAIIVCLFLIMRFEE